MIYDSIFVLILENWFASNMIAGLVWVYISRYSRSYREGLFLKPGEMPFVFKAGYYIFGYTLFLPFSLFKKWFLECIEKEGKDVTRK